MMKKIFFGLAIAFSCTSFSAFKENSQRYISGYDFENRMSYFFEEVYKLRGSEAIVSFCFSGTAAFGFNMPANGKPINSAPNSATINILKSCPAISIAQLGTVISEGSLSESESYSVLKRIFPSSILDKKLASIKMNLLLETPGILDDQELKEVIAYLVQEHLGTEDNILSYGLITDVSLYHSHLLKKVDKALRLKDIYIIIVGELILRDEFLTY